MPGQRSDDRIPDQFGFISVPNRLLYVSVPKVACTSLKSAVATLAPTTPVLDPLDKAAFPAIRGRRPIHVRRLHPLSRPSSLDSLELHSVLQRDGWLRFTVVRDPLQRLFSAWVDKILLGALTERLQPPELIRTDEGAIDVTTSFGLFVSDLAARPDHYFAESHFTPQVRIIRRDLVNYTHVVDLADLNTFVDGPLSTHLGRRVELERFNEGLKLDWRSAFTEHSHAAASEVYSEDLNELGYSPQAPSREPLSLTRRESDLIDELRSLNHAFDRLAVEARRRRGSLFALNELGTAGRAWTRTRLGRAAELLRLAEG